MRSYLALLILSLSSLSLTSCTTAKATDAMIVPDLTYQHVKPVYVDVVQVRICSDYEPVTNLDAASQEFPIELGEAVERFATQRIQAGGEHGGQFIFDIQSLSVTQMNTPSDSSFYKWAGVAGKDHYEAVMQVQIYAIDQGGTHSPHSVLTFKRELSIPDHYSIARREMEQFKFTERFVQDIDDAVSSVLEEKFQDLMLAHNMP